MWVFTIDIIHQFLVLRFVYNSNDLIALFHIVGADRLIDRSAAVQVINDKMAQLFFFFCDNADPALYIMVKVPRILKTTVFLSYTKAAERATHMPDKDMAFPRSIWRYLFMILATISRPPEEAFRLNRMLKPILTVKT